jgi:hypothetical protein
VKKIGFLIFGIVVIIVSATYFYIAGREYVIRIPEATIREKLSEKLPISKSYLIIFTATLSNPRVDLVKGDNRINVGVDVLLNIRVNGKEKALGGTLDASGALKYIAQEGAFYLSEPLVKNLSIQGLPPKYVDKASLVIEKALTNWYSSRPVYKLKSTDVKQAAAKLVLKSLVVHEESIIVTLGI